MSSEKKRIKEQMLVNSAIASIKRQISDLENSKKLYVEAAATAKENGISSQYNLARNAIRIVSAQKNVVEQMLLNLQLSAQIKDVSEMTKSFADGMKLLSGSIVDTTDGLDFEKVNRQMNKAMLSTANKQAESDAFLDATQGAFDGFNAGSGATDKEIDLMIEQSGNGGGDLDDEIEALERKLKMNGRT